MPDRERLDRRLRAVERTLTGDDHDIDALAEAGALARRVDELEESLAAAEERIEELEAATQALRGYVGNVKTVNEDVARRADAAIAAVDRLEAQQSESGSDTTRAGERNPVGRTTESPERRHRDGPRGRRERDDYSPESAGSGAEPTAAADERETDAESVLDRLRTRL